MRFQRLSFATFVILCLSNCMLQAQSDNTPSKTPTDNDPSTKTTVNDPSKDTTTKNKSTNTTTSDPDISVNIGLGSLIRNGNVTDYSNTANTLTANSLGWATPQYLLGLSLRSSFPNFRPHRFETCKIDSDPPKAYAETDCSRWRVRPWSGFVNVKFSPSSNQTINGYVIGGTYSLLSHLDILVGYALTPVNEPSYGLRTAASQYVTQQQKQGLLLNFNPTAMLKGSQNAFDGFSLLDSNSKLIYTGTPLEIDYRGGVVVGVSFPFSLMSLVTKTNTSSNSGLDSPQQTPNQKKANKSANNPTPSTQ